MRLVHSFAILGVIPAVIGLLIPEVSAPPAPLEPQGKIVFQSDRDGNNEVYSMTADGSEVTRLTYDPAADDNPVLSPDGAKIAFVSHRTGYANIYVMNVDGTDLTRVTSGRLDLNAGW